MSRTKLINTARALVDVLQTTNDAYSEWQEDLHTLDLVNKGIHLFQWDGLPNEIPLRLVERNLFLRGKLAFFKHETMGYFMLPFVYTNRINPYGVQKYIRPIAVGDMVNFGELEIDKDCVIVRDNDLEIPPILYARFFGEKISNLYSIRDKNNNWLNFPAIIKSSGDIAKDNKNALEIKSIIDSNKREFAVITDALSDLDLLNIKPQYFGAEIYEQLKTLKNDYLTYLGLDHRYDEKKERLITDEVNSGKEEQSINLVKRLRPREIAVKQINDMFGLNVSVKVNDSITPTEEVNSGTQVVSLESYGASQRATKRLSR